MFKCIAVNDEMPMFEAGQVYNYTSENGTMHIHSGVFKVDVQNTHPLIWTNNSQDVVFKDISNDF